jgi:hypothetical protein
VSIGVANTDTSAESVEIGHRQRHIAAREIDHHVGGGAGGDAAHQHHAGGEIGRHAQHMAMTQAAFGMTR